MLPSVISLHLTTPPMPGKEIRKPTGKNMFQGSPNTGKHHDGRAAATAGGRGAPRQRTGNGRAERFAGNAAADGDLPRSVLGTRLRDSSHAHASYRYEDPGRDHHL